MLWKGAPKVSPHVSREPPRGASALRSRWKPPNSAAKPRIPHERQIHLAGDVPGPVGATPRHGALRQPDCSQTGGEVDGPAAGIDYRSEEAPCRLTRLRKSSHRPWVAAAMPWHSYSPPRSC